MKQCALPGERPHNAGTPLMSGGQALFLLLILLTVSMCVSVLLSPESRRRRRERVEREAREKARVLRRKEKEWNRSVKSGLWLTQPDGAVCVCVAEKGLGLGLDGDASRSRRRRPGWGRHAPPNTFPACAAPRAARRCRARRYRTC